MSKKLGSSVGLSWLIREQMRDDGAATAAMAFAVLPDPDTGWRVIIDWRSRRKMTPAQIQRLAAIEKKLQETYTLIGE
jgi:hypothetical protein